MSPFRPKRMPQELWDMVTKHLPPYTAGHASRVFNFRLLGEQKKYAEEWQRFAELSHSIFKDDSWRSIAKKANLSPVLIGWDLQKYTTQNYTTQNSTEGSYLVLCVGDRDSNIQCEREAFFKSLQPHIYYEETGEVHFKSSLVLNVAEVVDRPKIIPVHLSKIFSEKCESRYIFLEQEGIVEIYRAFIAEFAPAWLCDQRVRESWGLDNKELRREHLTQICSVCVVPGDNRVQYSFVAHNQDPNKFEPVMNPYFGSWIHIWRERR